MEAGEYFNVPISTVFDLHPFAPRDTQQALEAYLDAAFEAAFPVVRIVHGRGIGVQRAMVRSVLARTPFVTRFSDAPFEAGGWGATIADLVKPPVAGPGSHQD